MGQPLLARDVVRYRRRAGRGGRHRGALPGRGRRGAGGHRLRPAGPGGRHGRRHGHRRRRAVSRAGTNVAATFGDAAGLDADLFGDCEVVVSRTIVNQRVAPAPMEVRAGGRGLGRGRPADRVDARTRARRAPAPRWRPCSGSTRRAAGHHPGCGGRLRGQVRRRPGARGGVLGGPAARPSRALGREPGTKTWSG